MGGVVLNGRGWGKEKDQNAVIVGEILWLIEFAVVPYETTVNNVVEIASGCSRLIATRGHGFPPGIAMTAPPLGAGEEAGRGGG